MRSLYHSCCVRVARSPDRWAAVHLLGLPQITWKPGSVSPFNVRHPRLYGRRWLVFVVPQAGRANADEPRRAVAHAGQGEAEGVQDEVGRRSSGKAGVALSSTPPSTPSTGPDPVRSRPRKVRPTGRQRRPVVRLLLAPATPLPPVQGQREVLDQLLAVSEIVGRLDGDGLLLPVNQKDLDALLRQRFLPETSGRSPRPSSPQ